MHNHTETYGLAVNYRLLDEERSWSFYEHPISYHGNHDYAFGDSSYLHHTAKKEPGLLDYFCHVNNLLTLIFSFILLRVLPRPQTKLFACLMVLETLLGFSDKF